ncbi:putative transcription elongation factor Spt5-like protein [Trifolium medium]|uniref:Putative transcription elongation factor Spt5-like protein n=1 Tax=Trifolium medium TaxID=97028 RepID=A0A392NW33_9FABA|nr:putative transcription elongation factor Spt5-like protein [Trifolium medium]
MTNNGKANANSKGKAPAGKDSSGKRKVTYDEDKTGKKRNRGVVQFFEDEAVDDSDEDSDDFSDFSEGTRS